MQTSNKPTLKVSLLVALITTVCSRSWNNKPFYEDCKYGDVLLAGLFSIHEKTVSDECDTALNVQVLANAQAMVHAIDQVNKDPHLLPNITLGYRIFDTCGIPSRANSMAFSFVIDNTLKEHKQMLNVTTRAGQIDSTCPGNISTRPIAVVIGPGDSASSVVVASMLQVGNIAQISPSSTSDELSQTYYKTFFRTVPPDSQQAEAISDIIEYFNWRYIALIGSDSSYGRYGVRALEHEALERHTFCIHTINYFPPANYENKIQRIVANLKRATNVKVVVLWAGGFSSVHYFFQECYRQKLFDRTWIAPDGWSDRTSLLAPEYSSVIGGFIGTTFRHFNASNFEEDLLLINASSQRSQNKWWREFWQQMTNCSQFSWKGCGEQQTKMNKELLSIMRTTTSAYVIDAVQAAAHAIDSVYRCQHGQSNSSQITCSPTKHDIRSVDVLRALKKIQFQGLTGTISFNENGDSLRSAVYDIVNYQIVPGGTPILKKIGTWDRAFKERLQLRRALLVWKNGSKMVPSSRCSEPCPPGTRQSPTIACCWECIPCPIGAISTSYSSTNCTECEADEKANHDNTACEALPLDNLSLNDNRGIGLMVATAIGVTLTLFTLGVFVKFRDTPVVKSSNEELSYVFLFSILVAFFAISLLIVELTPFSCSANMLLFTIYFDVCVSILFLRTSRLVHVFNFQAAATSKSHWFYNGRYQFIALAFLNLLPVVLTTVVLVIEPPEVQITIVPLQHKIIACAHETSTIGIIVNFSIFIYKLILSILVAYYAFKARKLPSNFNETKYIAFNMYIQLTTSVTPIAIFTTLDAGSFKTVLYCLVQLCCAFSFLLCSFVPKLIIILRYPEKNTPEFVKAAVARNTMERTLSNAMVVSSAERSKRTLSEPPLSTLPSNDVPSLVENGHIHTSNDNRVPRRVTWDSCPITARDNITERAIVDLHMTNGILSTSSRHLKGASSENRGEIETLGQTRDRNTKNDTGCAFYNYAAISMDKLEGNEPSLETECHKHEAEDTCL